MKRYEIVRRSYDKRHDNADKEWAEVITERINNGWIPLGEPDINGNMVGEWYRQAMYLPVGAEIHEKEEPDEYYDF